MRLPHLLRVTTHAASWPLRALRRHPRRSLRLVVAGALMLALTILICEHLVASAADGRVYHQASSTPSRPVALVLGTSKTVSDGRSNLFYTPRIDTAAALYHAGVVRGIVVSGDHSRSDYNEPGVMRADLIAAGVPAEHVTCDYAGFDTLDSIHRIERVFGYTRYVVVSQDFHVRRALFIAEDRGHDAVGCIASGPSGAWAAKVRAREALARIKAVLETKISGAGPRYLGPREEVGVRPVLAAAANGAPSD